MSESANGQAPEPGQGQAAQNGGRRDGTARPHGVPAGGRPGSAPESGNPTGGNPVGGNPVGSDPAGSPVSGIPAGNGSIPAGNGSGSAADPAALAPAKGNGRGSRYKWVALSNTTLGMLAATVNASIVIISLPAIFRGVKLNPLNRMAGAARGCAWCLAAAHPERPPQRRRAGPAEPIPGPALTWAFRAVGRLPFRLLVC